MRPQAERHPGPWRTAPHSPPLVGTCMPWLHLPEPLGAGRCTLACTARRPGPAVVRSERARGVYAMAAHRLAQTALPRSAAERAVVARGVHPGMHRPRGRSREGAARRSRDGGEQDRHGHARHRPVSPSCVTTATPSLWVRHRRTARPSACLIPSRFSQAVGIATKSPLCIHTSSDFSAVFRRRRLDPPASPPRPRSFAVTGARRAPRAAVRRRRAADRYSSADPLRTPSRQPVLPPRFSPTPLHVRSGSQGSPRFLRVLPGSAPAVPTGM